jgi:hypothetical protein
LGPTAIHVPCKVGVEFSNVQQLDTKQTDEYVRMKESVGF